MIGSLVAMTLAAPVAADDPDGDDPAGAIPIVAIGAPQAYDTSAATANEVTDPAACDGESGHFDGPFTNTFWHSFTAAADGDLIVDVNSFPDPEADGFLAIVFVVEDDGAGGFSLVACSAFGSTVRFAAVAGTTYYAMTGSLPETPVGGPAIITILEPFVSNLTVSERATYDQATNGVTIHGTVECASPANLEVSVFGSQQVGSHLLSGDGFAPAGECDGEHVWSVTIFAFNSFFNPGELEVFVEVFACTAICSGDFGTATVRARPGKPVSVEPPPPPPANDEREGAVPIGLDETAEQDTNGATANAADPGECPDQPIVVFSTATVWYSFSTTESGFVEINTFGSDYDTTLFVLQGDTIVACNDQAGESNQSRLSFAADGAYDIMIGAWQDSPPGNLVLNVVAGDEPPPPPPAPDNDERDSPVEIVVDGAVLEADTTSATSDEATDPQACPDLPDLPASEHTVWYAISGHDGWVEVNTFDSDFDTTLYVLDGNDVVACDDDTESRQSRVVFLADPAATYEVMAGTFDGSDGGNLVIRALSSEEPPPPPEPFEFIFTLNDVGTVNTRTGEVTIGGTIACSSDASGFMFASSFQEGGRFVADGFAEGELACNEEPAPWSLTIFGSTTKFQAGEAFVGVDAFVQTEDGAGAGTFVEGTVRLVPVGSAR